MSKNNFPHEGFIQEAVIKHLEANGCRICAAKELWEHGVDIKARFNKYSRYWLIEVKGGSKSDNANSVNTNNFVFGLGQIVTRIQSTTNPQAKTGSNKYGVAYPYEFKKFLERQRLHWNLCKNLNLYVFLVKPNGDVEEYNWKRVKKEFF